MLRVQLPDSIRQVAEEWVASRAEFRALALENAHVTIVFIGRDLEDYKHDIILQVARSTANLMPDRLTFQGRFSMFGGRRDHLVGLVMPDDRLNFMRETICDQLRECGIVPERSFLSFTPHFTLAKGLPGDGGVVKMFDKKVVPIIDMNVKLGSTLHISIDREQHEETVTA